MSELILTKEEIATTSIMEWDSESIGNMVKKGVMILHDNENGAKSGFLFSAALVLCNMCYESNAEELKETCKGVTMAGKSIGDYEILVRRIDK